MRRLQDTLYENTPEGEQPLGQSSISIEVPDDILARVLIDFQCRTGIAPARSSAGKIILYRDGRRLRDPRELKQHEADIYHAVCEALLEVYHGR